MRLKRVLLEVSFPIDEISRLHTVMLKVFIFQEHTVKRLFYLTWLFLIEAIRPCNIGVSLLLSVVSQKKEESSTLGSW